MIMHVNFWHSIGFEKTVAEDCCFGFKTICTCIICRLFDNLSVNVIDNCSGRVRWNALSWTDSISLSVVEDRSPAGSGVTRHRQPRQCRGAQGPKTVKGAQSDPNYVSRLLLDCVPVFHKTITLPIYFTIPDRSLFIIPKFIPYSMVPVIQWRHHCWHCLFQGGQGSECLPGRGGGKNYSYITARRQAYLIPHPFSAIKSRWHSHEQR